MFRFRRSILSLFVIAFIALTWLIAYLSAPQPWSTVFWYKMGGIWIAEALLGATIVILGKNSGRALAFHAGNLTVAVLHLVCVLLLFALACSEVCMLLCQICVLIVALLFHTVYAFAQQTVRSDDAAVKQAFALRNELLTALEIFEVAHRDAIGGDAALASGFAKLKDAARFLSDAVPGCEAADDEVRAGLAALKQSSDAAELTRAVTELTARIEVRQNIVKRSR